MTIEKYRLVFQFVRVEYEDENAVKQGDELSQTAYHQTFIHEADNRQEIADLARLMNETWHDDAYG